MPTANRSAGRDVQIYDVNDPTTALGGLLLTDGVTNASSYSMVDIVCIFDPQYFLRDKGGMTIQRDNHPLHAEKYCIVTSGSISVNDELWLVRTNSAVTGTDIAASHDAVRE